MSVVRRHLSAGRLTKKQASAAVEDLLDIPMSVFATAPLLRRVWELRDNLTAYDASYVALAEAIDRPLVTADHRLANAPGVRCQIELL